MEQLIQTSKCSIIYGTFRGKENQELFRCPRELDDMDLPYYINQHRALVAPMGSKIPFVNDSTPDLRDIKGETLIGYYRMYFSYGWGGRWMLENGTPDSRDCAGVQAIINWICKEFPSGCDYYMVDFCKEHFIEWGSENRYLVRPFMSEYYKVAIDTTYGNGDYPVRIYTYK